MTRTARFAVRTPLVLAAAIGTMVLGGLWLAAVDVPPPAGPSQPGSRSDDSADAAPAPEAPALERTAAGRVRHGARAGYYDQPRGTRIDVEIQMAAETAIARDGMPAGTMAIAVRGRLAATVANRRDHELILAVGFPGTEVSLRSESTTVVRLDELGATAVLVWMREDGVILGKRAAVPMPQAMQGLVEDLATAFVPVIRPDEPEPWTTPGRMAYGTIQWRHIWERRPDGDTEGVLVRERVAEADAAGKATTETRGRTQVRVLAGRGWPESVDIDEATISSWRDSDVRVTTRTTASAHLLGFGHGTDIPMIEFAGDWPDCRTLVALPDQDHAERERMHRELGGRTASDLLAEVVAAVQYEGWQGEAALLAQQRLTWLLRLHPETAAAVLSELRRGSLEDGAAAIALAALRDAQSPAGESALADLIAGSDVPTTLREQALGTAFGTRPSNRLLQAVWRAVDDVSAPLHVRAQALLLAGDLTARTADTESLVRLLQGASVLPAALHGAWLEGLGNCRLPSAAETARAYLAHADPTVRAAAVFATRGGDVATFRAVWLDLLQHDNDVAVRIQTAVNLARDPDDLQRFAAALADEAAVEVRRTAVQELGERLPAVAPRRLLEQFAASDPDAELRELASGILRRRGV